MATLLNRQRGYPRLKVGEGVTIVADNPADTFTTEFEGSELLFDQAMAQSRMAVCMTNPHRADNPIVFANEAFLRLTGYGMGEVLGRNCRFLQGPDTDREQVGYLRRAIAEEKTVVVELLNYRKDGTPFWNALHLGPIYDEGGELMYYFGSQWDVTEVYDARMENRASRMLARELSHRLKNVFAVLGSVVSLSGRREGERGLSDRMNQRIAAVGRAYDASLDGAVRGEVDIEEVVERILSAYDSKETSRYTTDGPQLFVPDRILSVLGLCLHELATNSLKYGAWSAESGQVDIRWHEDDEGELVLEWHERGGPEVDAEAVASGNAGQGTSILQTLVRSVRGDFHREIGDAGLEVCLAMPLHDTDAD